MMNFRPPESSDSPATVTAEKAISFISKGWREVKDSTKADIRLMKARANSFKNLASSFDREFENFLRSSCSVPVPVTSSFHGSDSGGVLNKWSPSAKLRIDLKEIKQAIVSEVEFNEREGFRVFKSSSSLEVFEGIKNSEFLMKVKSSLKSICKEPDNSKYIPPLDMPELLAYLVRQSGPFLDQLGVKKDVSDKIIQSLCTKRKNQLQLTPIYARKSFNPENDTTIDDLDSRIASVLHSTGLHYETGVNRHELTDGKRHVAIVTTASLPWMTGTAVNPLFRAAYLAKSRKQSITLLVPWLTRKDQELVYPNNITFTSPEEQEVYIRSWLEERVGFKTDFKISFYPGKFQKERRSIIPAGDTSKFISSKEADIAILEEPEHLNWYHHGNRWTNKFNHVVGIVHTNYLEYIKREKNGALQAFFVKHINNLVTRAYCDKVLRLSAATQDLPKSVICNVHGVNPKFLKIGEKTAAERENGGQSFSKGAYFLGKMVWAKGYRELIDLLAKQKDNLDNAFKIDVYGNGEDANEVQSTAKKLNLNVNFMKGIDHADDSLHSYKVFINPSVSDVLCTATAEALAMGKFVVCADHPSNDFFRSFPNCLTYNSPQDFVDKVNLAMDSEPHPLTPDQRFNLSWEAATQRFMESSELDKILTETSRLTRKSNSVPSLIDGTLAFAHYCFTGNEFLRLCTGAVPGTRDYNKQHSSDLQLLPPHVENPIYGW
ncbi:putative digalactosyldiacylglycerol synthase [Helianthus annuus]|nr:putative digalactosyldiacylglycerol synthase [Helianthus annuus]